MKRQKRNGGGLSLRDNQTESRTQEPMQKGRNILLAVRIFLLVIFQVSVIGRIGFVGATPDILLAYFVTVSITAKHANAWKRIAVSALLAGFLADAIGGVGVGVLSVFYFLIGAFCPNFMRRNLQGLAEELLFYYIFMVPSAVLRGGVTLFSILLTQPNGFSFLVCLQSVLLPEFFGTLLFALPVFFVFRGRD